MEMERFKFFIDRVGGVYLVDAPVNLEVVVIHDHHKVVQFPVPGKHRRLPDLAFLDLTVTEECVYTVTVIPQLRCECHTDCRRDALAEGTA